VDHADIRPDPAREPLRSEARLMTLYPRGFTLQLLSAREPGSAQRFIRQRELQGLALPFRFIRDGKQWTAVVYGSYESRGEARSTIGALKPRLKDTEPWIRPLADVQAAIRAVWRQEEAMELKGSVE
jgi:septal ring-binding cell division protein DamX